MPTFVHLQVVRKGPEILCRSKADVGWKEVGEEYEVTLSSEVSTGIFKGNPWIWNYVMETKLNSLWKTQSDPRYLCSS